MEHDHVTSPKHLGVAQMEGRLNPGGPIWLPYVILIIGIEQGAKLETLVR